MTRLLLLRTTVWFVLTWSVVPGAARAGQAGPLPPDPDRPPVDDALLLQAGGSIPVGLTTARTAERRRVRQEALDSLARQMNAGELQHQAWLDHLEGVLTRADTRTERWIAAARVVGELGQYELAPHLAAGLPYPDRPRRRLAACGALYRLYGEWFEDPVDFEEYPEVVPAGSGAAELHLGRRELRDELVATRARNLQLDPAAAEAHLGSADWRLRLAAAQALRGGVDRGLLEPRPAVEALLAQLEREVDPRVYQAGIEAALEILPRLEGKGATPGPDPSGGAEDSSAPGAERRRLLTILEQTVGARQAGFELPVARSLARLPWNGEGDEKYGPHWGLDLLAQVLEPLAEPEVRADPDVIVNTLDCLGTLCSQVGPDPLAGGPGLVSSRAAVLKLLRSPALDDGVRAAAAAALPLTAVDAENALALIPVLIEVLESEGAGGELLFAAQGALGRLARQARPEGDEAARVFECLAAGVRGTDADLRSQALGLLADPALEVLVRGRDLSGFVEWLGDASLRGHVISLLRTHGTSKMLNPILGHISFAELASAGGEFTDLLESLAAGQPVELLRCAQALVAVNDEATRVGRLVRALRMVAKLDPEEAAGIETSAHRAVVAWALELRQSGVLLPRALGDGEGFLQRLVDVHLPGSAGAGDLGEAARLHARGLFLGDLLNGGSEAALEAEILTCFARALELASDGEGPGFAPRVRRDRARYFQMRGQVDLAAEDYRRLIFGNQATDPGPGPDDGPDVLAPSPVLEPSDLRSAANLLAAEAEPAAAADSFDVLLHLVVMNDWTREPAAQRLADLRSLLKRAEQSGIGSAWSATRPSSPTCPGSPPRVPPSRGARFLARLPCGRESVALLLCRGCFFARLRC